MDRSAGRRKAITSQSLLRTTDRRRHRRSVAAGERHRNTPVLALHRMAMATAPARDGIRADRHVATGLLTRTSRSLIPLSHRDRNTNLIVRT